MTTGTATVTISCHRNDCTWERTRTFSTANAHTIRRSIYWLDFLHFLHLLNKHQWDGS